MIVVSPFRAPGGENYIGSTRPRCPAPPERTCTQCSPCPRCPTCPSRRKHTPRSAYPRRPTDIHGPAHLHVSAILVRCDEYAVIGYSTMLGASIAYDERRDQQRDRCVGVCSASPVPASPASSPRLQRPDRATSGPRGPPTYTCDPTGPAPTTTSHTVIGDRIRPPPPPGRRSTAGRRVAPPSLCCCNRPP